MEKTKPKLREKVLRAVMAALIALSGVIGFGAASVEKAYADTPALSSVSWNEAKPKIESHMGTPYVWAGRSTSGWDCSGFVSYVMHDIYGTAWPGGSWGNSGTDAIASFCADSQVASGTSDSTYNAQFAAGTVKPGDIIIFYNASGSTVHAAIAGDNATVYHAWYEGFGTGNCRFDYMWGIDGGHGKTYSSYKVFRGLASEGWIKVQKTSSKPSITTGDPHYSFAGTTFKVYTGKDRTGLVATLTIDGSATSVKSGKLAAGTYWVYETASGKGFELNTSPEKAVVEPDSTAIVTFENEAITGNIDISKKSADTDITNGNGCYNLAGAEYGVYASSADAKAHKNPVGTMKTDSKGHAVSADLPAPETYWVAETEAPAGYAIDETVYKVPVEGGKTCHLNGGSVTEIPLTDPVGMLVGKVDATTTANIPQGAASLSAAQFTVAFYGGQYDTEAQAKDAGAPGRTWVFQTDADGFCYLSDAYKVSGPELYRQSDGKTATLPLGTAFVTETKAPVGYNLDDGNGGKPKTFVVHITEKGAQGETVRTYNTPTASDTVKRGDYRLMKEVPTTNDEEDQELTRIPVEGVQFQIINSNKSSVTSPETGKQVADGKVVCTIVTDENGIATTRDVRPQGWTGSLAYGTYTVHEVIPEDVAAAYEKEYGIKLIPVEDWQITISKDKQYDPVQIVANHIPQTPIRIEKVDADTGKSIPMACSFQLYDGAGELVTYNDRMNEKTLDTWTTLEGGHVTLPMKLDAGTYTLVEVQAPEGYVLSDEPVSFTVDEYRTWDDPIVVTFADQAIRAEIKIVKVDADDNAVPVAGATYCIEAAEDVATGDGTVRFPQGEVIGYVTTDENGMAEIDGLYLGSYIAYETKSPEGWALDTQEHQVAIQSQGQTVPIVVESLTLEDEGTDLAIVKTDSFSEGAVEGATFHIRQVEAAEDRDGIGYRDVVGGLSADCTTDENGTIFVGHMPHGTFVVEETAAPAGYVIGEDCTAIVKVDDQGFIGLADEGSQFSHELALAFENIPVTLDVSKVDLTGGFELEGAELVLKDSAGAIADQWVSTNEPHRISPILPGKYTLTETAAPQGYLLSSETVEIEILETGEIQTAAMANDYTRLDVSKTDATNGSELPGATLQLKDEQGNVVDEWESTNEPHRIEMLAPGKYTLTEAIAPDGYLLSSETVEVEILATGEVQSASMENDFTKVDISKTDIATGKELPGATLQIIDSEGTLLYEWVSGKKPYRIVMLEPGDYTLREITAPDGYEKAEDVEFTVDATGEVQKVVMEDSATPGTPGKDFDKTGVALAPIFALIAVGITAAGGLIGYGAHKRRKAKADDEGDEDELDLMAPDDI